MSCLTVDTTNNVEQTIQEGGWKWPRKKRINVEIRRLKDMTPNNFVPMAGRKDEVVWAGHRSGKLLVGVGWS